MTKEQLTKTIKKIADQCDLFIEEAIEFAHKKCPEIPSNVDDFGNSRFWGMTTAYIVAKAKQCGMLEEDGER